MFAAMYVDMREAGCDYGQEASSDPPNPRDRSTNSPRPERNRSGVQGPPLAMRAVTSAAEHCSGGPGLNAGSWTGLVLWVKSSTSARLRALRSRAVMAGRFQRHSIM